MAEHKILGILLTAGLLIVAGIFWVLDDEKAKPDDPKGETVAVAPPETATSASPKQEPQISGEPLDETLAGKVLVAKRPVQVLAAPSASASAMFGFPAGRPFRAISRHEGFVRIQDVKSGASGWIEEAALAPAPTKPVAATPSSTPRTKSATSRSSKKKPRAETASAEPESAPPRKRRGLFGGDGFLGGLFGGR